MMDERLLGLSGELSESALAARWEAAKKDLPAHGARVIATLLQMPSPTPLRPRN